MAKGVFVFETNKGIVGAKYNTSQELMKLFKDIFKVNNISVLKTGSGAVLKKLDENAVYISESEPVIFDNMIEFIKSKNDGRTDVNRVATLLFNSFDIKNKFFVFYGNVILLKINHKSKGFDGWVEKDYEALKNELARLEKSYNHFTNKFRSKPVNQIDNVPRGPLN